MNGKRRPPRGEIQRRQSGSNAAGDAAERVKSAAGDATKKAKAAEGEATESVKGVAGEATEKCASFFSFIFFFMNR